MTGKPDVHERKAMDSSSLSELGLRKLAGVRRANFARVGSFAAAKLPWNQVDASAPRVLDRYGDVADLPSFRPGRHGRAATPINGSPPC